MPVLKHTFKFIFPDVVEIELPGEVIRYSEDALILTIRNIRSNESAYTSKAFRETLNLHTEALRFLQEEMNK